jgi:2-polyprenyl-6-methoxyphenol hydroxylase-like FAD-dependent oxidoreductase
VTLVGDAASSLSLFGEGSSLAMAGAATLACALAQQPSDIDAALHEYEAEHRGVVASRQRYAWLAAALLVPRTRAGLATRNLGIRLATGFRGARATVEPSSVISAGVDTR